MTFYAEVREPDLVQFQVRISMNLYDWKKFLNQLEQSKEASTFPAWKVIDALKEVITKAESSAFEQVDIKF